VADKHPYISAPGYLVQVVTHFRRSFPTLVTAETLKKLGFAPKNESYVLNVLRFLGFIDQEGNRTDLATKVFSLHDDTEFSQELAKVVTETYSDLFELHGENAWELDADTLITFFRSSDETTEVVGQRQAKTFQLLAAFSGHGEVPEARTSAPKPSTPTTKRKRVTKAPSVGESPALPAQISSRGKAADFGLTVRIEINLPADGDQETYDRIFRSIRENLLSD
jgi:hypothetical protein